jgi:hypothetical protein
MNRIKASGLQVGDGSDRVASALCPERAVAWDEPCTVTGLYA